MLIKIVMLIFILLLVLVAVYLLSRRGRIFIIFDTKKNPEMNYAMTITAISLIVTAIVGTIILFLLPKTFNLITLVVAITIMVIFSQQTSKYNQN